MNGVLTALGGVALGAILGWFLVRSRFSLARVFCRTHAGEKRDWVRAYLLAISLVWFFLGASAGLVGPPAPVSVGFYAAALGGVLAGLAFRVLGSCTLALLLEASGFRLPALVAVAGWTAGVLAVAVGPAASVLARITAAGPVPGLAGLPLGPVLVIAGAGLFGWLQRATVSISPEKMEWPKQGVALAVLVLAGWALCFSRGEAGGLNGVAVVMNLVAGPEMWAEVRSVPGMRFGAGFFVAVGLIAFGLVRAVVWRGARVSGSPAPTGLIAAMGGGFLLGIASAIGGGNPAAHALAGIGFMKLDSVVFIATMWGVGWVAGIGRNREGGS